MSQKSNLYVIFFVLYASFGAFFPFNTLYLKQTLGYTGQQIGLFYALSGLSIAIIVPIVGLIADYLQKTIRVMIITMLLVIVLFIPYGIMSSYLIILIIYLSAHSLRSSLGPLLDSYAFLYTKSNNLNYGLFRALGSLAFIISSIIVGYLLSYFSSIPSLFIYIHIGLLIITLFFLFKQKNNTYSKTVSFTIKDDLKYLLKNKRFLLIILIISLVNSLVQVSTNYVSLSILEVGGSNEIVGLSFFFQVLPEVILISIIFKFLRKYSHTKIMLAGVLLYIIRWSLMYFTSSLIILLFSLVSHGIIVAFVLIIGLDLINKVVAANLLASAITLYTAISSILYAVLVYISGLIIEMYSIKETYLLYILLSVLSIGLIIWYDIIYKEEVI